MKKYWAFRLMRKNKIVFFGETNIEYNQFSSHNFDNLEKEFSDLNFNFCKIQKICKKQSRENVYALLKEKLKKYAYGHQGHLPEYNLEGKDRYIVSIDGLKKCYKECEK